MIRARLFALACALALSACAHSQTPIEANQSTPRCGDAHTRAQAAAVVAVCDREIAAASDASEAARARLHYGRAVALTNVRDLPAAIDALTEAVALDPSYAPAFRLRGYVYWRQRAFAPSLSDTEEALRLDPEMAMAYYTRGLIYSLRGDGAEAAIAEVTRAHELEPANPVFLTARCEMRAAAGLDPASALADCDRALELRPQHADTHVYRGRALLRLQRFEEALSAFEASLALAPDSASARYGRGMAQTRSGNIAEGRVDIDSALAADEAVAENYPAL